MATLCRKRVADTLELSAVKAPRLQPMASGDRALGTHGSDATAATPLQPAAPASPNSCRQRLAWLRTHKDEPAALLSVAIELTHESLARTLCAVQHACAAQLRGAAPGTACSALDRAEALMEVTLRRTSIALRLAATAVEQRVQPQRAALLPQATQHHTALLQLMAALQQQRAAQPQANQDDSDDDSDGEVTSSFVPACNLAA